jgi:hypothetical protein
VLLRPAVVAICIASGFELSSISPLGRATRDMTRGGVQVRLAGLPAQMHLMRPTASKQSYRSTLLEAEVGEIGGYFMMIFVVEWPEAQQYSNDRPRFPKRLAGTSLALVVLSACSQEPAA